MNCQSCNNSTVIKNNSFVEITSDCKLSNHKSKLCVCEGCGLVQKVIDNKWKISVQDIYADYTLYYQADGTEQAVFDSGIPHRRSKRILQYINPYLRPTGRYLDIGCGIGTAMKEFRKLQSLWAIVGNDKTKYGDFTEKFYSCKIKHIPRTFNLITMIHTLEHIVNPVSLLEDVRDKLTDDGMLVINVPDYKHNPFDLFITDHATHFTIPTLCELLSKTGFDVVEVNSNLIPKEMVAMARKSRAIEDEFVWVKMFLDRAIELSQQKNFGVFGTSVIAMWLYGVIGKRIRFFVDEDPERYGKKYLGIPVYSPKNIPSGSNVFLALPPVMAKKICKRLSRPGIKLFIPPDKEGEIMKVFLGGTCNESDWREFLISRLKIDYFNPVVEDWTPECMEEELRQRKLCDYVLYIITPKMTGVYSIAEVVDDSNKQPSKTIFCYLPVDDGEYFSKGQKRSLDAVGKMVLQNGGKFLEDINEIAKYLNNQPL